MSAPLFTTDPPLTNDEFRQRLGVSWATFYTWQKAGKLNRFRVTQPIGPRKWSRILIERHEAGESLTAFGAGSRVLRRA